VTWPKASQASIGDDKVIRLYNGPPVPASLLLTLVPVGTATVPAYTGNPDASVTAKTIDANTAREFCDSRRDIPSRTATLACGHTITY
jgi:hypothetical protein